MSDYDNPRPSADTPYSDPCAIKDNATTLGKVLDESSGVVTYTGKPLRTIDELSEEFGWRNAGLFADGFTFQSANEYGVDSGGQKWVWNGAYPYIVTAGTIPAEPLYTEFTVNSLQALSGLTDPSDLDGVFSRVFADTESLIISTSISNGNTCMVLGVDSTAFYKISSSSGDYSNGDIITDSGLWAIKLNSKKIQDDISALKSLIASGELVWSVLGDSTEAGVGAGGGVYAQCNLERANGWANYVNYYMIKSDGAFIDLLEEAHPISQPFSGNFFEVSSPLALGYPSWQGRVANDTTIEFYANNASRTLRDEFTVYVDEYTSDAAAEFRMTIRKASDDTILYQGIIDTYAGQESFSAAGSFDVQSRLSKRTVTLSESERYVKITIDMFDTVDRGSGKAADGTAAIYGFTFGNGVEFHNLSVSSTTLKDNSADNQSKGVTTSERLSLAQSFNTNVFVVGWATNDSKAGVSTPSDFESELNQLISDIYTYNQDSIIILSTDPEGKSGSIYENNPEYNTIVRRTAEDLSLILMDVERLSQVVPDTFYADNVHPSSQGVYQIVQSFCEMIGVERGNFADVKPSNSATPTAGQFVIPASTSIPVVQGEIFSQSIPRNNNASFLLITVNLVCNDSVNSDVNTTASVLLNGFQIDKKRVSTKNSVGIIRVPINLSASFEIGTSASYVISVEAIDHTGNGNTALDSTSNAIVQYLWV